MGKVYRIASRVHAEYFLILRAMHFFRPKPLRFADVEASFRYTFLKVKFLTTRGFDRFFRGTFFHENVAHLLSCLSILRAG
jgi:hypothetical protein